MTKRVLAIASAGGHWQQLMLMRPAYAHHTVHYVNTLDGLAAQFDASPVTVIPDCNRDTPFRALATLGSLILVMIKVRPHVIISTGALPGVMALALGKLTGAKTIWVDSVANAEQMSSSGRLARRFASHWLSQWEGPAKAAGADYKGAIL
jgi:UDP-N-acetylglucosamine:LPS N-acetylglucosamine transferase